MKQLVLLLTLGISLPYETISTLMKKEMDVEETGCAHNVLFISVMLSLM